MSGTARALGAAFVLGMFATLIGLGLWQMDRRAWKHELIGQLEAQLAAPAIQITYAADAQDEVNAWRRVTLTGAWGADSAIQISLRTLNSRVGVDFIAPFVLTNGDVFAVRLGWAPAKTPPPALSRADTTLEGVLFPAPRPNLFTPDNDPPNSWLWLEPLAVAKSAGHGAARVSPLVLNLDSPPPGLSQRPSRPTIADDHLQYALTWFSLAIVWLCIAFLAIRQRLKASAQAASQA